MTSQSVREGVGIAWEALRSNKVRAALTIVGIVIGVSTVIAMAALITGIRSSVTGQLDALGPKNFVVERWDQTQVQFVNDGSRRPPWEGKPPLTAAEAEMIRRLPSIHSVSLAINTNADARFGGRTIASVMVLGRSADWSSYDRGTFLAGRNFLPSDDHRGSTVVVLSNTLATALLGDVDPVGQQIRLNGERFTVIGVYEQAENIFSGAMRNWLIVPHSAASRRLKASPDWSSFLVVPVGAASQADAMDDVTAALRASRGMRPADENNFALIRQEAFLDMFNRITGIFFIVMLVLSSIGLMVGGVGVMAIMMISVTERTREIGVRKALGATRREILWQFLIEAVTVTVIGGAIGLALGAGGAFLVASLTPIPASVPVWMVALAISVLALTGIAFGLYPASRASRLDPVDALRYE
jgi:putative ABC transport system permease protein